jgi:signal transduction histidine kinase
MPSVEFKWKPEWKAAGGTDSWRAGLHLSAIVLERNARWFITVRWVVVGALGLVQVVLLFPDGLMARMGIVAHGWWPAGIAGVLACMNTVFTVLILLPRPRALVPPHVNLWAQITVDLVCLTALVHFCGSIATPAPFLYVLHIVLSCVFFSSGSSFKVAFMAIIFYLATVTAEMTGIFGRQSIFAALEGPAPLFSRAAGVCWAIALSVIFVAVWYLVSQLSLVIRARESQLIDADEQIRKTQEEKDRYAVQMTHQLKAPLDAVRSTIALITGGYSGGVSEEIRDLLSRIDKRAQGMAGLVMDVLKLARVKASPVRAGTGHRFDVGPILGRCIENLRPVASARQITIESSLASWEAEGVPEQIEMLFDNIISNAVVYSKNGQTVTVACAEVPDRNTMVVTVSDAGIGIEAEYLPHIFDEYFRSPDAARHNSASSGIGLAIVKAIAQGHGLSVRVDSVHGAGTKFSIGFPRPMLKSAPPVAPSRIAEEKEIA